MVIFFGRIAHRIKRLVKKAAPVIKSVARVAAPIAGGAAVVIVARKYTEARNPDSRVNGDR